MAFYVGQKVVCVDAKWMRHARKETKRPQMNQIYTIREILHDWVPDHPTLRLVEIINARVNWSDGEVSEPAFDCARFRPVVERKTDISIFTQMLSPARADA